MILIELWGGPQDGRLLALPELRQGISFPVAPDLTLLEEDTSAPLIPAELIYMHSGRIRGGLHVYRYAGTQEHR